MLHTTAMKELLSKLLELLERQIGVRLLVELVILVLVAWSTAFLVSRNTTGAEALAVTYWLVLWVWYVRLAYRTKLKRLPQLLVLALAISASIGWSVAVWRHLTSVERQLSNLTHTGSRFAAQGMYGEAVRQYDKALSLARGFTRKKL